MRRVFRPLVLCALVLASLPAAAGASLKVATGTSGETLVVAADGSAQITWREGGRTRTAVGICGTATYHGKPFFGFKHTASGNPLDELGRDVYIDVKRGSGWYRLEGVLTRPKGFALLIREAGWRGPQYRALVSGPNIAGDLAPDVIATTPLPERDVTDACPFPVGA